MTDMDIEVPSESEDDDSDWLKQLGGDDSSIEAALPEDESSDPVSDAPSSLDAPAELPPPESTGIPDWMDGEDTGESPQAESHSEEEDKPPDWLSSIREAENIAQPEKPVPEQGPDEDDADWLDRIRESEEQRLDSEDPIEEDVPFMDRIQSLEAGEESAGEDAQEQQSPDLLSEVAAEPETAESEEDESPDWLSGLLVAPPSPPEESLSPEEELAEEDLPSIGDDTESGQEISPSTGGPDQEAVPQEPGFVDTGSLPSWLADMKRTGSLDEAVLSSNPPPASNDEEEPSGAVEELPDLELTPGDLPDWITDPNFEVEATDEIPEEVEATDEIPEEVEGTETEDAASADMPKWLYGMRPIDSPYAPVEGGEGVEETVGPLAGLQDVLPAEPEIVQFGKPPVFSMNLEVTNSQQQNAELFEKLISSDNPTLKSKTYAVAFTQSALRWAIAGLFFVSLLVPILSESTSIPLPAAIPPEETLHFQSLIKELDQEDTVLVAFDYQPGMSGEMHSATSAVIDDLLLRGAQLAIISTQPTGPALAEIFFAQTQAAQHRYAAEKSYRMLGYFSGGNTALLNLAQNPRLALPVTITVEDTELSAWDLPPLQNISSLSDFSMLIVVTDDPDTARSWIEQVQPALGETPLVMVISAQAEPLVRPYFQSEPKKVNGFVAGILGGAYYEQIIGREHIARQYWNSYSTGLGVAVLLIFFGSLAGAASYLLSRRKSSSSEVQV